MSTERVTEGRDVELAEALDRIAERDGCDAWEEDDGPCMQCPACIQAEAAIRLRALQSKVEELRTENMELAERARVQQMAAEVANDQMERAEAALSRKDAALRAAREAITGTWGHTHPASEARGVLKRAVGTIDRALASEPEATDCYCTPGVYTPSAMCPTHGATSPEAEEEGS